MIRARCPKPLLPLAFKKSIYGILVIVMFFGVLLLARAEFHARSFPVRPSVADQALSGETSDTERQLRQLTEWVSQNEQVQIQDGNIKSEFAKQVQFVQPEHPTRTRLSLVYIHGMSASKFEIHPVVQKLATELRANVFYTRLKGHGGDGEGMLDVQAEDWIQDAYEAVEIGQIIGEKVILIGTSTGAPLAIVAGEYARQNLGQSAGGRVNPVAAQILLSPNFMPAKKLAGLAAGPLGVWLAKLVVGSHYSFHPDNPRHAWAWTTRYPVEGIVAMMDLLNLVETIDLKQVPTPTLCLYTQHDRVVSVEAIQARCGEFPHSQVVDLNEANRHEIAGEILSPQAIDPTLKSISDFLKSVSLD